MAATHANTPKYPGDTSPACGAVAVTPSDSAQLTHYSRALWIGGSGGGALKVTMYDGSVVAFASVTAGTLLPIRVKLVWSTGTDVTSIVSLY